MHFNVKRPSSGTLLLILLFLVLFTVYTSFHHHGRSPDKAIFYRDAFLSAASNYTISDYLRRLTLYPHLAGTTGSLSAAFYVKSHFQSLGLSTVEKNFSVLLSYPTGSSLLAQFSNGTVMPVTLSESGVPQNGVVLPYHAYSISGSAQGKVVFLNYGREKDYRELVGLRVEVNGSVGLVRRGSGLSRYDVVANAAKHGVCAVLMYTESDFNQGVERGTVINNLGDPLSPGWPAGGEKLDLNDQRVTQKFPGVPSLPISQAAAEMILSTLEGPQFPSDWVPNFKAEDGRIGRLGPGPTILDLSYQGERKLATIHNVFAVIKGSEEPDKAVLLGNHRDAWSYGAVDPNSGTAALLDLARRFSHLMSLGWNPRRTIVLCSWDAEEFGMIGSTEWVEKNVLNLGANAVAYLNVDCAVQGPGLFISATPQLDDLIVEMTKLIKDPDSETANLHEKWVASNSGSNLVQRLNRIDSDFAPFLHHAGVPSLDIYFGSDFSVYHTAFDTYDWMVKFGDPLFHRHVAVAGLWGLIALRLAGDPIIPFNYLPYATDLKEYMNALKPLSEEMTISIDPIAVAVEEFTNAARQIAEEIKTLKKADERLDEATVLRRRLVNDRLMLAERGFLEIEGDVLPQGQWFKHLIYGPIAGEEETSIAFFPGIAGARGRRMQHEIWRVARAIERSASALTGQFT